jgi:hypothetical protein
VRQCVAEPTGISEVIFCCFSDGDLRVYETLLDEPQ